MVFPKFMPYLDPGFWFPWQQHVNSEFTIITNSDVTIEVGMVDLPNPGPTLKTL